MSDQGEQTPGLGQVMTEKNSQVARLAALARQQQRRMGNGPFTGQLSSEDQAAEAQAAEQLGQDRIDFGNRIFDASELQDRQFYLKNKSAIDRAMREGRVRPQPN